MKPKALITGATGYIGAKLCQQLLADGWQIGALVRNASRALDPTLASTVTVHPYDGSTESVLVAVSVAKPDIVFHLASLFVAEHSSAQVTDLINSNLLLGAQLAEACARTNVKRFINTGTAWQHYRRDTFDPVCLYAATKQGFEDILDFYADAFGLRVITLSLFDTYGPDDPRPKLFNLLLKAMTSGETLAMSPGDQRIDLVHIDDVISAFVLSAQKLMDDASCPPHARYAVCSGQPQSIRQLVAILQQVSGKAVNVTYGARPYREREVMMPWPAGKFPPGWHCKTSLEKGLIQMIEGVKKR